MAAKQLKVFFHQKINTVHFALHFIITFLRTIEIKYLEVSHFRKMTKIVNFYVRRATLIPLRFLVVCVETLISMSRIETFFLAKFTHSKYSNSMLSAIIME